MDDSGIDIKFVLVNLADDDKGDLDEEAIVSGRDIDEYVAADSSSRSLVRDGAKVGADAAAGEQG